MRTDAQQGILLNVVVGIVGAFLAGLILSPLFGMPSILAGSFSLGALLISLLGAVILLAIVNLFRRGSMRCSIPRPGRSRSRPFASSPRNKYGTAEGREHAGQ